MSLAHIHLAFMYTNKFNDTKQCVFNENPSYLYESLQNLILHRI